MTTIRPTLALSRPKEAAARLLAYGWHRIPAEVGEMACYGNDTGGRVAFLEGVHDGATPVRVRGISFKGGAFLRLVALLDADSGAGG